MNKLIVFILLFSNFVFASEFYNFTVKTFENKEQRLSDYKEKIILVVNVASKCGFTYQYEGLEALYKKYSAKGFVILAFPSNQFLGQEPASNEEIQKFCKLKYGVDFPVFSKVDVKGDNAIPLFKWLVSQKDLTGDISWNFNKFLLNKKGQLIKRYGSRTKPEELEADIEKILNEK